MWVAAAVVGAAVVGAVASNVAANKASNAADDASKRQASSAKTALELEKEQFEYQKQLNEPFYNMGLPAAASYASAITGEPQKYVGLDGVERTSEVWRPEETDAYKWQQSQMEKNTNRSLRAMGRYNSTYGMDAITKGNRDLAASEYDRQLGRLSDLTNVARGGASSLSALSGQYANNAGTNIVNSGNNQANSMLAGGLISSNATNNNVQGLYSLANMGMQYYGNKK